LDAKLLSPGAFEEKKMPRNSKNSPNSLKGNSFELLGKPDDGDSNTDKSYECPWASFTLRAQHTAASKRANSTKVTTSKLALTSAPTPAPLNTYQWERVEALLTRIETALAAAERRAERAGKHVETLEEFIRNELFLRVNAP
jgi:hypothetical protein